MEYTEVSLEGLDDMQTAIVNAVIKEGEMRQAEKIVALIERKITEAYALGDKNLIEYLESLIVEIEGM
jgi:hypothetical protein